MPPRDQKGSGNQVREPDEDPKGAQVHSEEPPGRPRGSSAEHFRVCGHLEILSFMLRKSTIFDLGARSRIYRPCAEKQGSPGADGDHFHTRAPAPIDSQLSLPTRFSRRGFPGDPHAGPLGVGGFERAAPTSADPKEALQSARARGCAGSTCQFWAPEPATRSPEKLMFVSRRNTWEFSIWVSTRDLKSPQMSSFPSEI